MRTIAILVFPGVQSLDVSGPMDVFAEANRFLGPADHYRLLVVGTQRGSISCSNGLQITPHQHYSEAGATYDLVLVAGGPELARQQADDAVSAWLRQQAASSARIGSVCNGAFLLAHAGLLAGKTVTTHWNDGAALAAMFPETTVDADRIFLRDGNLYSSAGVTAGIDLSLYLLFEDFGPELSLNVARRLVVFMQRRGGQSQFSPYLAPYAEELSVTGQVQQYVLANLQADLTVAALARQLAMSPRNFARVFVREARATPADFIESARIDAARVMLESGNAPLKTIAFHCGFRNRDHMRAVFMKRLGVTALQYRANFSSFAAVAPV